MTATLTMILYERGLLDINDPVQKYIPEFTGEGKDKVLVHQLMSHTTGLRDEDIHPWVNENWNNIEVPNDVPLYLRDRGKHTKWWYGCLQAPLTLTTGGEMSYCNTGYGIQGLIINKITGQTIHAFARDNLFKPLGMKDTGYWKSPKRLIGRLPERVPREGEEIHRISDVRNHRWMGPSGGVTTTMYDAAIFCQTFMNGGEYGGVRILSPENVRLMTTNRLPGIQANYAGEHFDEAAWGWGWGIDGVQTGLPTKRTFNHGGYGWMNTVTDPALGMIVIIMMALNDPDSPQYNFFANQMMADACLDYEELKDK